MGDHVKKALTDKNHNSTKKSIIFNTADKHAKKQLPKEMKKYKWKEGKSGNPKGRPKKEKCIPDILNKLGDLIVKTEEGNKITQREFILLQVYGKAMQGDQWSIQFIADRTEGKPFITQNINLGSVDSPLVSFRERLEKRVAELDMLN